MGLLDRIFGKRDIKIKEQTKKEIFNEQSNSRKFKASYGGGSYGNNLAGSGAGGAKWSYGLSADGRTRVLDHYRMRQNARDLFHDSLDARGIIERLADTVVDTGLILEATPNHEILGITSEAAEAWSTDVERRFHLWASDKKQHRAGLMSFYQAQRLYEIGQQRDNDNFVRLYYSNKKRLQNPLQYDFIDPNQIRGNAYTSTYAQYTQDDGIIKNPDGTEKAYKIWLTDNRGYKMLEIPRVGVKSGRLIMIHGFNPEYPGQSRGYARLGFAFQEMENITDFTSAAIKKAINQSNMVMSVENQKKDPGNPLESISQSFNQSASGGSVGSSGSVSDESETIVDNLANIRVCPAPEAAVVVPGSMAFVGNEEGDNIKMLETKAPADSFKEFIEVFTERLSAAVGVSQEVVLMKFSNNYSASRATLLLFWKVVMMWRMEMSIDFLNPVYEMWLSEEIAAGRITALGWNDPVLRAAWTSCTWIGSPLPSIDPGREAKARKDNLEMNITTLEREARNLNGSDVNVNIEKNKKHFETLAIPPWGQNAGLDIEEESDDEGETDG